MTDPDIRSQIEQVVATTPKGENPAREVARLRAESVADAFTARKAVDPETAPTLRTVTGAEVRFGHVELIEGGVEVWLGDDTSGPPDYRIFNPPTLARDPQGDIEVRGQKYREDPLAALAEAITSHSPSKKRSAR